VKVGAKRKKTKGNGLPVTADMSVVLEETTAPPKPIQGGYDRLLITDEEYFAKLHSAKTLLSELFGDFKEGTTLMLKYDFRTEKLFVHGTESDAFVNWENTLEFEMRKNTVAYNQTEDDTVGSVEHVSNFLTESAINPDHFLDEILYGKDDFFQPREANYMKYRGHQLNRTKAFIVDNTSDRIPVYVYTGFIYESVLHYVTFDQYGGMLLDVKNAVEKFVQHPTNHVIVTKYHLPDDGIGWHNDKDKTITDNSVIAVLSMGTFACLSMLI
jgi:hypothetical protein